MVSRFVRASFALVIAAAATAAVADGGGGIGRAGTYPPQFGPGVPSHVDLMAKEKSTVQNTASTTTKSDGLWCKYAVRTRFLL